MPPHKFAPGFRLSMFDAFVLAAGAVVTIALARLQWWWGFVVPFVLGHFFLFCNVIRMARPLELIWAGVFVALTVSTVLTGRPGWIGTAAASLLVTALVVLMELRKPSYHGLGWQKINPELRAWWKSQNGESGIPPTGAPSVAGETERA